MDSGATHNPLRWADHPEDSASARLGKSAAILSNLITFVMLALVAAMCAVAGELTVGLVVGLVVVGILVNQGALRRTRNFAAFMTTGVVIAVIGTLSSCVALRGVPGAETLILWAVVMPMSAAISGRPRPTLIYTLIFLVMVGAAMMLTAFSTPRHDTPSWFAPFLVAFTVSYPVVVLILLVLPVALGRRELATKLHEEHERSEKLLLNVLPPVIAERLKRGPGIIADSFPEATVLFADIVGFTPLSARLPAHELVLLLNEIFSAFDLLAQRHGLEKIKTIGDAYMAAAGIPSHRADHALVAVRMAVDMLAVPRQVMGAEEVQLRIGVHTGPVVAGVIGKQRFIYDLWGDTVNTASRMESHGAPGRIHLSAATYALISGDYAAEDRGEISLKGKGPMHCYFLKA